MSKIIEVNTVGGDMIDIHLDNGNILLLSIAVLLADERFAGLREDDRILFPHTDGNGIYWRDGPGMPLEEICALMKGS